MPAEQCFGLDEESPQASAPKEPTQSGEQRPVIGPQCRVRHLAVEHRHLVSEYEDLDREVAVLRAEESEQLDDSNECQIEERQRHGPVST
jgi:hypothetical protein